MLNGEFFLFLNIIIFSTLRSCEPEHNQVYNIPHDIPVDDDDDDDDDDDNDDDDVNSKPHENERGKGTCS